MSEEEKKAHFTFHGSLNDFRNQKEKSIDYFFRGKPSVKDAMEAMGVPHPEVEKIVVNEQLTSFSYQLNDKDCIEVFPYEKFPISSARFILDVHLGALSRYLRLLGIDAEYNNQWNDFEIIRQARMTERVVLTRDVGLLKHKSVILGYWLRSTVSKQQVREVLDHFHLRKQLHPLHRCLSCNGVIEKVNKDQILEQLPPRTRIFYHEFYQCGSCHKVYWPGAHFQKIQNLICELIR